MRHLLNRRSGLDQVLAGVAATFLIASAPSFAQDAATPAAPSTISVDALVPVPEPANVPPPTVADFKADGPKAPEATATVTPAADPAPTEPAKIEATAAPVVAPAPTEAAATATSPATPAAPTPVASAVPASDQPVADLLRETLSAKTSKTFTRRGEKAAVEKFYTAREFAPLWTQGGTLTSQAKKVITRLGKANETGLNANDYPVPDFATANSPAALAEAELALTSSVLDYVRHANTGRMHFTQAGNDIQFPERNTDPVEVLTTISSASDVAAAFDGYHPQHKSYQALKAKLNELRNADAGPVTQLPTGPALRVIRGKKGQPAPAVMEDDRVPQLRAKLGLTEKPSHLQYDNELATAVRKFQSDANLKATGILDDRTVEALNAPKRDRQIDTVLVNMERLRWLPRQLGASSLQDSYVVLNVPDFSLKVMRGDKQLWTTRVIVGKVGKQATPMLSDTMKYITVNPTWNVPPSIIYGEYLPALQQDPGVLDRMGLKLTRRADGSIHVAQPPGDDNALGRIRFNFPNKYLVYMHDTPNKSLFARDVRAFSHGCMRVQNPDQYASTLLNIVMPNDNYTPEKVRGMYGSKEVNINFPTHLPVHLTYETAFVDSAGKLQMRKDLYGRDAKMIALLRNPKNIEAVVAHAQPNYSRPRADLPQGVAYNDQGRNASAGNNPMNFFERLFNPGGNQRSEQRFVR